MIKKPFFSCGRPKLKYPVIQSHEKETVEIPLPEKATVLFKRRYSDIDDIDVDTLKVGDRVKTGQRISPHNTDDEYFISPVTGTVADISEFIGYLGLKYTSISINTVEDEWDYEFKNISETVSPESAIKFLGSLPGCHDFFSFFNPATPLDTIIISGIDNDLLVTTNQFVVETRNEALKEGVAYLKKIFDAKQIILLIPPNLAAYTEKLGAEIRIVDPVYPAALPEMVITKLLNKIVPAGKRSEDIGVGFISSEAVASLSDAFGQGKIPVDKIFTVINKDDSSVNMKARIGTPVKDVLESLNIDTEHGDRLVLGGPMRGQSIYSVDMPISADTDAIMVQNRNQILLSSDVSCLNCGECVRACPAKIPVNMLIRLLENGLYEETVHKYDLLSCIECGLCSYVCVARIPVFHFIMLGKYEFGRLKSMEEANV